MMKSDFEGKVSVFNLFHSTFNVGRSMFDVLFKPAGTPERGFDNQS
jgi:hypothetical protein